MTHPDDSHLTSDKLTSATMDDELCLFVHSLLLDGREVPDDVQQRARSWASDHPSVAEAMADLTTMSAALTPATTSPSAGFTERVLAARAPVHVNELAAAETAAATPSAVARGASDFFTSVRRLSVAAALAIVGTFGYGAIQPAKLFADDDPASLQVEQTHAADAFIDSTGRTTPEAFEDGLNALIEADPRLSPEERDRLELDR